MSWCEWNNSLTDCLFCSVLLPLFTVVGMDRCEEDVIIACGHYLPVEEEKRKKRKYWIHKVFPAREEEGEFHTLDVWKMTGKNFSNVLDWVFSEIWKLGTVVAHRPWKEEYKMETEHKNRKKTSFNFKTSSLKCIITNNMSTCLS